MRYETRAIYLSGGICGAMWWPVGAKAGKPISERARGPGGFMERFSEPVTLAEALMHVLMREGGDFQNPQFTADSEIVIERRAVEAPGKYRTHVRRISVATIRADLVDADAYVGDFFGGDE